MIYTNTSSLYLDLLTNWLNYADANGFSREDAFYHVTVPTPWSGFGGSTQPSDWFWAVSNGSTDLTDAAHDGGFSFGNSGQSVNVGYTDQFREIDVTLSSGRSGGWSSVLEYPTAVDSNGNPTSWATVNTLSDTTSGLTQTGQITFNPPSNWVTATINGSARLYYVRFRTTAAGTAPVASSVLGYDYDGSGSGSSGTIPVFDYAADLNHTGYLTPAEYAVALAAGDTAWFAYQSRLTTYGPMRFVTDPSSPAFQQWAAQYDLSYLNQNPLAAGLFMDNSDGNAPVQAGTVRESVATYTNDYGTMMQTISQAIAPRWIIMNIADGGGHRSHSSKQIRPICRVPTPPNVWQLL